MFRKIILSTGSITTVVLPLVSTVACAKYKELHLAINVYFLPGDDPSTKTKEEVDQFISIINQLGSTLVTDSFSEISTLEFTLVYIQDDDSTQDGILEASKLINPLDTEISYSTFREFMEIPEDEDYLKQLNDIYTPYSAENEFHWGGALGFEIFKLLFNNITPEE